MSNLELKMMKDFSALLVPNADKTQGSLDVRSPYTGKLIATLKTANLDTVETALTTAHKLFRNRKCWLSVETRSNILKNTVSIMRQESEELALLIATEGGKPISDARVEVERAIEGVELCNSYMISGAGREIPMRKNKASCNRVAFTSYEPIGPVVAVSAFNHPLNLIVHQIIPAIAAGNPVIIKPAEDTPLSCYRLISTLRQAGLPDEWCQGLVVNDLNVATTLVSDSRVAFFSFIGSSKVGWKLRSLLSPGTRCALEHGGAAPVIVAKDADINEVVPLVAKGGFYHAGQVCVSVQRIYCHESTAMQFAKTLSAYAKTLKVGNPVQSKTDIGPLIRLREVSRIHDWVTEAKLSGAAIMTGGEPVHESCYAPTVIYNPAPTLKISTQEIFGPVVCVYPYSDIDSAIESANSLPVAFQSAVFTQNLDDALYISSRIDASAVMINDHTAFRVDWMPFAGLRESGLGVGGIEYTFHDMQVEKMTVLYSKSI